MSNRNTNTFGPLTLPSGKVIFFRKPNGGDRMEVLQQCPFGADDYVSGTELINANIAAKCVTQVDGQVPTDSYKHRYTKWDMTDQIYYQRLFSKMFSVDEAKMENLDAVADFLLNGSGSTASGTVPMSEMAQ